MFCDLLLLLFLHLQHIANVSTKFNDSLDCTTSYVHCVILVRSYDDCIIIHDSLDCIMSCHDCIIIHGRLISYGDQSIGPIGGANNFCLQKSRMPTGRIGIFQLDLCAWSPWPEGMAWKFRPHIFYVSSDTKLFYSIKVNKYILHSILLLLLPVKQGDNTFSSIHPSVPGPPCLSIFAYRIISIRSPPGLRQGLGGGGLLFLSLKKTEKSLYCLDISMHYATFPFCDAMWRHSMMLHNKFWGERTMKCLAWELHECWDT